MATNPIGQETKIIGIKMKKEMADEIENRADSMYLEPVPFEHQPHSQG